MNSIRTLFVIFLIIYSASTNQDDEGIVEVVDNIETEQLEDEHRNGRLLWSYENPMVNIILQTSSIYYKDGEYSAGDFFDFLRDKYTLPDGRTTPLPEYDFVIVGAGSAGCPLASRLTKNANTTVLLIEAGKPEMLLTDIPALAPYFQATEYVWQYYMEHQPGVCLGMENGRCFWPRGKAVGGSTVINYMIYTHGRPQDWDRMDGDGNYGWSYNEMSKYFVKLENSDLEGYEKRPHRGRDGVLPVKYVPIKTKLIDTFLEAGRILGHPTVDYNSPNELGFGKVQVTISNGRRQSAAKVFLHPHKNRRNLHILPQTKATKVLIDPGTKTAYGVEFVRNKVSHTIRVRKEVILSAGPIASPQLLMLSGIGPKDHLSSKGIPVIQDLPVGQTLYDHVCFPGLIFTLNVTDTSFLESRALSLSAITDWLKNGDNELTSPGAVEGIGYIKTPVSDDPEPVPDIELISIGGSLVSDGGPGGSKAARKGMRITDEIFDAAFGSIDNTDTWSTFPMLLHPKSVGYLELKDNNPFSHPRIHGNYLTHPKDVATFVAAIRHVQTMVQTEPFQRLGARLHPARYPTCDSLVIDSDEYWECAVRTLTATLHHQVATCRMGPASDPKAVVDPELRVHGINRLRVVDTSVIPRTTSAHTSAPGFVIGYKASDLIRNTWNIK